MKTELQKELAKLKASVSALESKINAPDDGPKFGDEYFFFTTGGDICDDVYYGHTIDKYRIAMGNFYTTKADVETFKRVNDRAIELRGDWQPDWGDANAAHRSASWAAARADDITAEQAYQIKLLKERFS